MKLISWNVNGLRAVHKKDKWNQLFELNPDVICLQETKAHPEDLPAELKDIPGYHAYFDHSKVKKGYSGVAIYSKVKPDKVEDGLGKADLDQEGRFLAAYFEGGGKAKGQPSERLGTPLSREGSSGALAGGLVVITCYFPNGGGGPERLAYKLEYYKEFLNYIEKLQKEGYSIIFCGDVNTAHNEIDLARPKENEDSTGFLRIERDWLDKVVAHGWVDTFRHLHPEKVQYSWWDMKTFARDRNVGWRLDYFFISPDLLPRLKTATIRDDIFGSDHCPVWLELK